MNFILFTFKKSITKIYILTKDYTFAVTSFIRWNNCNYSEAMSEYLGSFSRKAPIDVPIHFIL